MLGTIALMIPIITIIGAAVVIVYLRRFENQERMALIERGMDVSSFRQKKSAPGNAFGVLRAALLLIGAGLGLAVGHWLDRELGMEEVAYFAMLFIFGGLGLLTAYLIEDKKKRRMPEDTLEQAM